MNILSKKLKENLIFLLLLSVFTIFYYDSVLDKYPLNAHIWRQTDCLSITHFYGQGANLLEPEMHIQLGDDYSSGKTAGEFPILYYTVGQLYKIFGENYLVYRVFYLFILLIGTFSLYSAMRKVLKSNFWSTSISLIMYTSPVYVFYGVSFLTDVPAMCFIFIALNFLIKYFQNHKGVHFIWAMLFISLAGLIKISSLIIFVFLVFIFFIELLKFKSLGNKSLFNRSRVELTGFLIVITSLFLWYLYAHFYNETHGFKYTFNNIYPLWAAGEEQMLEVYHFFTNFVSYVYFSRPLLFLLLALFLFNLFLYKKISPLAYLANLLITTGGVLYWILWAPLMGVHDYYYAALLILLLGICIPFILYLKIHQPKIYHSYITKTTVLVFIAYNFIYCLEVINLKTRTPGVLNEYVINNEEFVSNMTYTTWETKTFWRSYEELATQLPAMGIENEDLIISLPDPSFNASLFLMNKKGWTNFENLNSQEKIQFHINKGAKYLVSTKDYFEKSTYLHSMIVKQVGDYKQLVIYKLVP